MNIAFAPIAMREVIFFSNIADRLKDKNIQSAFITFFEPGDDYLLKKGYKVISLHKHIKIHSSSKSARDISEYESEYNIENIRDLLLHEKLTFNRFDESLLLEKTKKYFDFFKQIFSDLNPDYVVQELGGFIAPMTLYFYCLKHGINHIFLEPAMFKGRFFHTFNNINFKTKDDLNINAEVSKKVRRYIAAYNSEKTIVTPIKDLHHFKDATLGKIINKNNLRKLRDKIFNKYIRTFSEEYDAIGNHILRYFQMYINRKRNNKFYKYIDSRDEFVYYPLHVPLDFQLTVRSNEYLDQISLLKYISSILPYNYYLYIKEHPAAIGAYKQSEIKQLLKSKNIKLIHPSTNSYDLISKSRCVITINSKVGVEALMQKKIVVVLGEAFYRGQGLTIDIDNLAELKSVLNKILKYKENGRTEQDDKLLNFFEKIYVLSYPGELYVNTKENLDAFSDSLYSFLKCGTKE